MPKKLTWSLGFCLAIILALMGVSSPASADSHTPGDPYTAPAPSKLDPAGIDQDQYCIPATFEHPTNGEGLYYVNGDSQIEGCYSTNGAAAITVTTDYNSGTWTFDYTGDPYTAPAPSKLDHAGTDQDQYCIPVTFFEHPVYGMGLYSVNGDSQVEGCHSTEGALSITITTDYNSGTWTFDYTDDQSGTEAQNTYKVAVGDTCHTSSSGEKYREVTAYFTNVADGTGRYVHSIYPRAVSTTGTLAPYTEVAMDVADGETAAMRIAHLERVPGLYPGTYEVKFWRSDKGNAADLKGYVVKRMTVVVPQCGKKTPTASQASGSLKRVGCKAARVTADARRFSAAHWVHYRVVRKPSGKKTQFRWLGVEAGHKHSFRLRHLGRVKTRVILRVHRPSGQWVTLDRVRMPRCRR